MPIPRMSHDEMRTALDEIRQALCAHEQWLENLNTTLICSQVPDKRDLHPDAHRQCRFGQWLYGAGSARIGSHPSFSQIASSNEQVHNYARNMLLCSQERRPISLDSYHLFLASSKQLQLQALTAKRELEEALYNLDPLTGAKNRVTMLTLLREQRELVQRKVNRTSIAIIDIDHFKDINDRYGHLKGDEVLSSVARAMMACLRPYDSLFRYGGEEFLLCAPGADLEEGRIMVERLRYEAARLVFKERGQPDFSVTLSAGLTLIDPDIAIEESVDRADKAMLSAKSGGRNGMMIWDASMR
jgi:diguanylate cyclase